ncbi:uncharacterized protein [Rutidosis leptorrhynchoides]|uniref:uncharacterized protein isoform X2 n=1 Tax=Rutidosis leptorrhynchoides TaxID=125765 RepID=UPI003A9A15CB
MLSSIIAVVWFASLCKFLHASFHPYPSPILNIDNEVLRKRNILLVIAHPDDESMFFSPTINQLTSRGHNVHILCMSTGNADGIGDVRKEELYRASAILKVPLQQVTVLDLPEFQDGFGKVWNSSILSKIVEKKILDHAIDTIITFDSYGVSGHCNHRDVCHGVQRYLLDSSSQDIEAWELISINLIRKYSGPIDIWLSLWYSSENRSPDITECLLNDHPRKTYAAMSEHSSQWVWFRKLFVLSSSYTYVNTLRKFN